MMPSQLPTDVCVYAAQRVSKKWQVTKSSCVVGTGRRDRSKISSFGRYNAHKSLRCWRFPDVPDEARTQIETTEPFMCTIRELSRGSRTKLIWWYIAALGYDAYSRRGPGEEQSSRSSSRPMIPCRNCISGSYKEVFGKAVKIINTTEFWQKLPNFLNPCVALYGFVITN